eukprot:jgi/Bigna1/70577/fgenesh1_pg.12_\
MDELSNKSTSTSLSNIASTLTDSKTAWTERYRGLANLSYLTRREDFHVAFAENKSELGQGISRSLKSLRSEIVREASFAVASIVRRCMDKKFSERIMDVLLERPQSNSVMRRFQMHAGQIICNQIFSTHILSESYLYVIAMTCGTEKIQKHSPLFIKALKSGMVCFNGATRRYSVACAMKIRDRVNEDVWGTIEAALSERQKRMMRSFEEADVPHLMLNVTKEKQDHKMREARVDRKKKALRKIRTSPFELPAIDINISALRTKFEYVDANKDGKVSQSELANVLQESGLKTRVARIRAANFFKIADSNNSGFVDADEFVVEYIRMQMLCVIRQIHRHFRKIDKNDDGGGSTTPLGQHSGIYRFSAGLPFRACLLRIGMVASVGQRLCALPPSPPPPPAPFERRVHLAPCYGSRRAGRLLTLWSLATAICSSLLRGCCEQSSLWKSSRAS